MKTVVVLITLFVGRLYKAEPTTAAIRLFKNGYAPSDSSGEITEFKLFAKKFFASIKANDTNFLKAHILFPITNSSFSNFDSGLEKVKGIDARLLLKKLHKLFPNDLISKVGKDAEFSIIDRKGATKKYLVTITGNEGGVESNANWFFIKNQGQYYFTTFTAEAG